MRGSLFPVIAVLFVGWDFASAAEPGPAMDVVLVTGEQPGPALWKVSSGEHDLWILGEVSPLPRKVKWPSKEFAALLADAQEVILHDDSLVFSGRQAAAVSRARELPDDRSLSDIASPQLRERIDSVARIYRVEGSLEDLSPSMVGTRFANASLKVLDLRMISLQASVAALARKAGVKVSYYSTPASEAPFDEQVQAIRDAAVDTCTLERVLDVLEDGGAGLRRLANAWATGDLGALRRLVPEYGLFTAGYRTRSCSTADRASRPPVESRVEQRTRAWLHEAERALRDNQTTLAVVPIPELFADDGYLAALRARGYEVLEPD